LPPSSCRLTAAHQGPAQVRQRPCLDLTDPFTGQREAPADFIQRVRALRADAEPEADRLLLALGQQRERSIDSESLLAAEHDLLWRWAIDDLDQRAEFNGVAGGRVEWGRRSPRLEQQSNLFDWNLHPLRELARGWLTVKLDDQRAFRLFQAPE